MNTLVIGASGLVGYEFYRQNKENENWYFTYRSTKMHNFLELDALNKEQLEELFNKIKPEVVIVPAAMPNVNKCEQEPELSHKNNVELIENVINSMKKHNSKKIVFFSTDYLFDGKQGPYSEEAETNPLNIYGKHKLECEKLIQNSGLDHLILRTTGIFGWEKNRKNFMYRVIDTLTRGDELIVPTDQYANPTYVKDLISATLILLGKDQNGIFNVVGPEYLNRVELSVKMAEFYGLNLDLIKGTETTHKPGLAPRPLKAGLTIDKITNLGIKMKTVIESLQNMKENKEKEDKYE